MAFDEMHFTNASGTKSEGQKIVESFYKELVQLSKSNIIRNLSILVTYETAEPEFHHEFLGVPFEREPTSFPEIPDKSSISVSEYKQWITEACECMVNGPFKGNVADEVYDRFREMMTIMYLKTYSHNDNHIIGSAIRNRDKLSTSCINYEFTINSIPFRIEAYGGSTPKHKVVKVDRRK